MFAGCILSQAVKKWSPKSGCSDKGGHLEKAHSSLQNKSLFKLRLNAQRGVWWLIHGLVVDSLLPACYTSVTEWN